MLLFFVCIFAQLEINSVVGTDIDSLEARKYNLFNDVQGFVSAQFRESEDMIHTHMKIRRESAIIETIVAIDRDVFATLSSYIINFRIIIAEENFRRTFVEEFAVAWPMIPENNIQAAAKSLKGSRLLTTSCCVATGCAVGAYAGALITRKTRTEVDTIYLPSGCASGPGGCTSVPVEIIREYYSINPLVYAGSGVIGSGLGFLSAMHLTKSRDAISEAIKRSVVAFDNDGFPITEQDIRYSKGRKNEMLLGTLGLVLGLAGSFLTVTGLMAPWSDMEPEKSWHQTAITVPVIVISGAELYLVTKFFLNKGQNLDRKATIERLKARRSAE